MRGLYDACRSPRGRLALNVGVGIFAITVSILAARHFAGIGWPFSGANVGLVAAAGVLFLLAFAFKAYGWHRLFAPHERPKPLTLGAACGAASVTGAALPGRFDDVVRVAVVRRATNGRAGVGPVCLSLFMLGLDRHGGAHAARRDRGSDRGRVRRRAGRPGRRRVRRLRRRGRHRRCCPG